MTRPLTIAILLGALAVPAGSTSAWPTAGAVSPLGGEVVPGELLVKFKPSAPAAVRTASLAAAGHVQLAALDRSGWVHARVAPGQTVAQALAAYARDPSVERVQPNYVYRISAAPNDPGYSLLWGWKNTGQTVTNAATQPSGAPVPYGTNNPGVAGSDMNLEKAWSQLTDCSGVVVAVIDSGVNYTHEDLATNMWDGGAAFPKHGYNFVLPAGNDPMDLHGHGTHVAGTIGAVGNNAVGTAGVCWKASLMAVRVMDIDGSGTTSAIMNGIDFAVTHGAKVINMSLGGAGAFDQAFSDAISRALAADVVVVVAAGNDGSDNDTTAVYPCNFAHPNLVCVAALDQAYQLASFSNWGATTVDVGAPGTNVVSTWPGPVVGDALNAGWTGSTTTAAGGWKYSVGLNVQALVDPGNFLAPSATYQNGTDDRVWKTFNLTGASAAVARAMVAVDVASGDWFRANWGATSGDPFASGTLIDQVTGFNTNLGFVPLTGNVTGCIGATCTIGFQLQSDATTQTSKGVAVAYFTIGTVQVPGADYNTENGTSMATPAVAGLAALIRAYNPAYTAADAVASIKGGGRSVPALAGKTTSGRAVDAMGSLAFVNAPTGLAAVVH